jgi:hypothetical protein
MFDIYSEIQEKRMISRQGKKLLKDENTVKQHQHMNIPT